MLFVLTGIINIFGHTVSITSSTNATCNGLCNGTATAVASGGIGPYTYQWDDAALQTTATATNLCAGTYSVTCTDNGDASAAVVSVTITQPVQLALTVISQTNSFCDLCNGSVTFSGSGGTAPYTYLWSNLTTTPTIFGLCAGVYTCTLTDANGCTVTNNITITNSPGLSISSMATTPATCGLCNGTVTPTITGGTPPYQYMWSNGSMQFPLNGACPGNYHLTVTDANGCTVAGMASIQDSITVQIVLDTIINANCANNALGSITVHAIGGAGGYTYLWIGGENTPTISNLIGGYYTVFVSESGGCSDSMQFYVGNNSNMYASIVNTTANCGNNGTAQLTTQGLNPPFTYLWSDGQITSTAINLTQGIYFVTITDNIGCSIVANTSIPYHCQNHIKGRIYSDLNQNCTQDGGEPGIHGISVMANPGNYYGFTDVNGDYEIVTLEMNNTITVNSNNLAGCAPTCPNPAILNVNFSQLGDTIYNNDFGYYGSPSNFDLGIHPGWTSGHPGFDKQYWIYYYNNSVTPQNALIRFTYDPALQYLSCTQGGVHFPLEHKIEWTINNIPSSNYWTWSNAPYIYFNVPTSVTNSDTICSSFEILPIIGDIDTLDNVLNICEHITGSHDPNSKDVFPRGQGTPGYITTNDSILFYTIHFQNDGNDTCFTVVVKDTLSQYVEPGTIVPGASSHPYTFTLTEHGILTFRFDNILLPDSNVNEPGSNGYFNYTVHLRPNLPVGTVIENTASIFFDFNAPVVTNTTVNTIALPAQIKLIENKVNVSVFPNPFSDYTMFEIHNGNSNAEYSINIYDMLGKCVNSFENITGNNFKVTSKGLESGMYMYKVIQNNDVTGKGKLIIE